MLLLQAGATGRWTSVTADLVSESIQFVVETADRNFELLRFVWAVAVIGLGLYVAYKAYKMFVRAVKGTANFARSIRYWWLKRTVRIRKSVVFRNMKGKFMAKYQIGELGSRIDDVIFDMEVQGQLPEAVGKRVRVAIGKAIGDPFMVPRKISKLALRHYFLGSKKKTKDGKTVDVPPVYQKLSGPKQTIPGPKPGEDVIPTAQSGGNVSDFLKHVRDKKAAA